MFFSSEKNILLLALLAGGAASPVPRQDDVQRFGNIAQVFTSYASSTAPKARPFQRGINSMQLMFDGQRWWVLSILWDTERPGNKLPKSMTP